MKPVTSVVRWSAEPAELDLTARSLCLVGLGPAAADFVRRWQSNARTSCSVLISDELNPALIVDFDTQLATAVVGWRLMLAGPEAEVSQLQARAIDAGAEETEIRVSVTSSATRRTYCVHCARIGDFEFAFGETIRCAGCARELRVRPHYSPRLAAYLAVADVD